MRKVFVLNAIGLLLTLLVVVYLFSLGRIDTGSVQLPVIDPNDDILKDPVNPIKNGESLWISIYN